MGILAWILLGLVAGALARFIMPGQQGGGIILTAVLGVVGALVGGFLGTYVFGFGDISGFDLRSIAIAVGGALLVLFVYGFVARGRASPGAAPGSLRRVPCLLPVRLTLRPNCMSSFWGCHRFAEINHRLLADLD